MCIRDRDTSYLKKREGKTTNFDIVLSNRETMGRCILYYPGTAEQLQAEELPLEYLTNTKYLFISMLNPVVDLAVDIARKAGAKIFIDVYKRQGPGLVRKRQKNGLKYMGKIF